MWDIVNVAHSYSVCFNILLIVLSCLADYKALKAKRDGNKELSEKMSRISLNIQTILFAATFNIPIFINLVLRMFLRLPY